MKEIFAACPQCNLPLCITEPLRELMEIEGEVVINSDVHLDLKCDMCEKVTIKIAIHGLVENEGEMNDGERIVN